MTFVANGYASITNAAPASSNGEVDAAAIDATNAGAATAPAGDPDLTIVTRVHGPEPGTFPTIRTIFGRPIFRLEDLVSRMIESKYTQRVIRFHIEIPFSDS